MKKLLEENETSNDATRPPGFHQSINQNLYQNNPAKKANQRTQLTWSPCVAHWRREQWC